MKMKIITNIFYLYFNNFDNISVFKFMTIIKLNTEMSNRKRSFYI